MDERTNGARAKESGFDLTVLTTFCTLAFVFLPTWFPHMPAGAESAVTGFVLALGGTIARVIRARQRHRRRQSEDFVERARR